MATPLEKYECEQFVGWCRYQRGVDIWHLPNENVVKDPRYWKAMEKQGWRKGLPDYLVFIHQGNSRYDRTVLLAIEMKRKKFRLKRASTRGKAGDIVSTNDPSAEQLACLALFRDVGDVDGSVCYGADDAIKFVQQHLK